MKFPKTPAIVKPFARDLVWNIPTDEKVVCLTFDDGPTPGVTDVVLDILNDFNAKATFFCLGKQVEKHAELFQRIIHEGHSIGNHSYTHLNGWKTKNEIYFQDIEKAQELIKSSLFRPPYGKISLSQAKHLKTQYKLIMWDVLSYDYDATVSTAECFKNVVDNVENGSIVVFHDSEKAKKNVVESLPLVLDYLCNNQYAFKAL